METFGYPKTLDKMNAKVDVIRAGEHSAGPDGKRITKREFVARVRDLTSGEIIAEGRDDESKKGAAVAAIKLAAAKRNITENEQTKEQILESRLQSYERELSELRALLGAKAKQETTQPVAAAPAASPDDDDDTTDVIESAASPEGDAGDEATPKRKRK